MTHTHAGHVCRTRCRSLGSFFICRLLGLLAAASSRQGCLQGHTKRGEQTQHTSNTALRGARRPVKLARSVRKELGKREER